MLRKTVMLLMILTSAVSVYAQSENSSDNQTDSLATAQDSLAIAQTDSLVAAQTQQAQAVPIDTIGDIIITQPEFKGGLEALYDYIARNFEYPEEAAKRAVNGTMEVEFTIERSGDVSYVGILKGLDYSIDDVILRLLKAMPRWIPATRNGLPVRYKVSMPLNVRASRNRNMRSSIGLNDYRMN